MTSQTVPLRSAVSILFASRRTMRAIVDRDPSHRIWFVSALSGIGASLALLGYFGVDVVSDPKALLALLLLDGPILGLVCVYLAARLLSWASQAVFSGRATELEVRAAVAWVSTAWIWVAALAQVRGRIAPSAALSPFVPMLDGAAIVVGLLAFLALLRAVGEVAGFSAWKTLGSVLVALLALVLGLAMPVASLAVVLEFV